MASKNKDMMARTAEEYAEDIATTAEIVRGWAKQMFEDAVNRRYRKVRDTAQKIGQTMTRFDAELAKPIIASRSGAKEMMAREVVARKGSKRVELSGPQADGRWVVTVMQEEKQVVPGEANDRFVDSKFYSTEAAARRAASKMLASRPGEKDMMAKFKIGDRVAYKPHAEKTAGELVEIRKPTSLEGVEMQYGIKQAGGAIMWVSEGMVVKASRPGAKDMMATRKPKVREKWETVFYEYFNGVPVSIMDSGKIKNDINAILASGADLKVEMPKLVKKYGRFSRPGAKATFKVEDRFYFGKGRKERFADDAKQIAQTILAQLGGGRFVAMTGAKNLAFYNNPPGLRMSIGRGAKDAIKYLRVDYDRGSDTYTMIFSNRSGSTVKSVNHVYADSLQRVFTSTTGFDTHL